jgi:hypothetical protein
VSIYSSNLKQPYMKKLIMLIVMLVPLVIFSQGLPVASNAGFTSNQHYDVSTGTRSIPPGTLVWSQPPDCNTGWACQNDPVYPFDAKSADDFMFAASPGQITAVRWWILWWNDPVYEAPTSFNIIIYDDNNCIPGNIVNSWNIPFAAANEDAGCSTTNPSREYWATLNPPFTPVAGQHYWIVTQPAGVTFQPQTGTTGSQTANLCLGRQDFPLLGSYWIDLGTDLAFELYTSSAPPLETPVSPWVFLLAGVLIASSVLFRYRRIL